MIGKVLVQPLAAARPDGRAQGAPPPLTDLYPGQGLCGCGGIQFAAAPIRHDHLRVVASREPQGGQRGQRARP